VVDGDIDAGSEKALSTGAGSPERQGPGQAPEVILTPDQRLRIFISSTIEELAAERVAARRAITRLHLVPVYYESGARPHPPRDMYRAYLAQSQVFVGIYWQRYGWVAPGMDISGLEDEYRLAAGKPMLLYLKRPAPELEPRLASMIDSIREAGTVSYRAFATPRELERLLADDLAVLLSEGFTSTAGGAAAPATREDAPAEEELPSGTVTFLLTDIEGSTRLWETVPEAMEEALERHNRLLTEVIEGHGGVVIGSRGEGDSFFAVFPGAVAAVEAAGACQLRLAAEAWPAGAAVRVRMGLHTGEARAPGSERVDHAPINRCARVKAAAHGGQVLVTKTTRELASGRLDRGFGLLRLGEFRLRDLTEPELIYQLTHAGLPADFPPLVALGERTGNLPLQATAFIGRAQERSDVAGLVASSRLVTLTGAGGAGKTRLSLEVATKLRDGYGDGAWLVELAAVDDEDMVAPVISQAMGVAAQPGRPILETLLDALEPQDTLIVLDNCEHLIGGCAKVADAIARHCPKVHLVATSREPLGIDAETIYRVPPLSLPGPVDDDAAAPESSDAVALFADRASKQGVPLVLDDQTLPLVVSICRRLDGLPLAIELAAARLRSLSLSSLAARLDQRLRLLTGGSRTAPQRQQTLRATIEWSYSLLHQAEQVVLRRLSVFADTFDLDAAEAVCGFGDIDVLDVTDLLGSLVDKSLVVAEPASGALRYRLLETIRQFADERLAEADGDEAAVTEAAHRDHYLSVAEIAAPHLTGREQGAWLARLDDEQANLRRAGESAARDPDATAQVLRLGVALKRYWIMRTLIGEGLALLLPVLDRPQAQADPQLLAAALTAAASLSAGTVDIAIARRLAEQAVTLARQLGADPPLIESLGTLSYVDYLAGDSESGLPCGQEAVECARRLGDDVLVAESLTNYLVWDDLVDLANPGPLFAEAIAATKRSGDHLYASYANNQAAVYALRTGDIPAARAYLEEAARAMQEIGETGRHVLINLGWVLRRDNDFEGARSSFESALRASRLTGERSSTAYASLGLACLAADAGDWRQAAVLHGVAQAFLDSTGQPWEELEASYREDSLAGVRANLGQDQFDEAYAEGVALSFDAAIALASGKAHQPEVLQ
jgi:predicted ATPase/class 3 adenylate cyclase